MSETTTKCSEINLGHGAEWAEWARLADSLTIQEDPSPWLLAPWAWGLSVHDVVRKVAELGLRPELAEALDRHHLAHFHRSLWSGGEYCSAPCRPCRSLRHLEPGGAA